MGLLSDILEANRERVGQIEMVERVPLEPSPAPPPEVACPVCEQVFSSDLALNNHIAAIHAQEHVYIKANGRVIRGTEVFRERVHRCEIVVLGLDQIDVQLQVGGLDKQLYVEARTDLLEHIPRDFSGEIRVNVHHGIGEKQFLMYFNVEPPFDTRRLNREVASLQWRLEQGADPDWNAYQRQQQLIARNELEKKYLDGFLAYSLGFYLDKKGRFQDGAQHLEEAMQLLRPYATLLAKTARRVLAIRMNCFSSQLNEWKECQRPSVFYPARAFFVDGHIELPNELDDELPQKGDSVYIDGFTERILIALKAFYARDFINLVEPLEHLANHPLAEDANNEEKLLLLRARTARVQGQQAEAEKLYHPLLYSPLFGREANEFCKPHERGCHA